MRFGLTSLFCIVLTSTAIGQERFPAVKDEDAWKVLPREPLPHWARILVQPLPKTTRAMLQLDFVHRAKNPIGPILAGKLRWAAADEIGCDYARRYAEADLRRAGFKDMQRLADPPSDDRAAWMFARKMTRAAHEVTDEEVAVLIKQYGAERVVGMVHTLAYANFQNRIFLALNVKVEAGGPLAPIDFQLDPTQKIETPPRPAWEDLTKNGSFPKGLDWAKMSFSDIEKALDRQKERKPRIPLPDPSRLDKLPLEAKAQATKIVWTNVSMGYQPLLTKSWFDCMRTFQQEAKLDRVFSNSMFWVITRSNECFY